MVKLPNLPAEIYVRSLDEALTLYAREFLAGRPLPTFIVSPGTMESMADAAKKSYTIHAKRANGSPVVIRRVMLYFRVVDAQETNDFRLDG